MKKVFVLVSLLIFGLNAHAALNKWVDAEGKVHYSDTLPPEAESPETVRNMSGKGQSEAPVSYSTKSIAEREADLKKSKQESEEKAQKNAQTEAKAAARKKNCGIARDNVRTLEESSRIVTYDEKGEKVYMEDAERAQKLEDARKSVSESCD